MAINPATGIDDGLDMYGKKKQQPGMLGDGSTGSTVPTVDPNNSNGVVQLSNAATSGAAVAAPAPAQPTVAPVTDTTKGNEDVLKTAQTSVLNQPSTTALQSQTQGAVSNWLANPMGGFDPVKNKQQQLEKANTDWANSFEAMKRQYGNVGGSGLVQKNMLGNMLQHNVDQADLESKLDTDNYNKYVEAMGKSVGAAQTQNKSDADLYSQYLANLGNVRGMAEGERAQTTTTADTAAEIQAKKDLTALGYSNDVQKMAIANGYDLAKLDKIYGQDMAKMIAQNNWQAVQNSDELANRLAITNANIASNEAIESDKTKGYTDPKTGKHVMGSAELAQQGLTLDEARLKGYTDPNTGEHIMGSLEVATKSLGLQADTVEQARKELEGYIDPITGKRIAGKIENMSDAQAQAAKEAFGWTDQETGTHYNGSIANSAMMAAIAKNADDRGHDTLYGYTDPQTNQYIKGSAEIAAETFGLASKTLEDQQKELFGYPGKDGNWVTGKIETMSNADKQAAQKLYGFVSPITGDKVYGELELQKYNTDKSASTQEFLQQQRLETEVTMQTAGFTQEQTMANINAGIAEAKANFDEQRAEQLQTFADKLKYKNDNIAYGREIAIKNIDADIAKNVQNNEFDHAKQLQQFKINEEAREFDATNAINAAELQLKQKGFTSEQIQAAVAAGAADPSSLTKFLASAGISTTPPDPLAAQKAAKEKSDLMMYQYSLTHPDAIVYKIPGKAGEFTKDQLEEIKPILDKNQIAGITSGISNSSLKTYNDFVNQSLYNEKIGQSATSKLASANPSDLQGADKEGHPMHNDYVKALEVSSEFKNTSTRAGGSGLWENHTDKFANAVPTIGTSFKGEGGKLYIATSGISEDKNDGNGTEYFYALDPATGNTMKITASDGGGYTTWQQALTKIVESNAIDPTGLAAGGSLTTNWDL